MRLNAASQASNYRYDFAANRILLIFFFLFPTGPDGASDLVQEERRPQDVRWKMNMKSLPTSVRMRTTLGSPGPGSPWPFAAWDSVEGAFIYARGKKKKKQFD